MRVSELCAEVEAQIRKLDSQTCQECILETLRDTVVTLVDSALENEQKDS